MPAGGGWRAIPPGGGKYGIGGRKCWGAPDQAGGGSCDFAPTGRVQPRGAADGTGWAGFWGGQPSAKSIWAGGCAGQPLGAAEGGCAGQPFGAAEGGCAGQPLGAAEGGAPAPCWCCKNLGRMCSIGAGPPCGGCDSGCGGGGWELKPRPGRKVEAAAAGTGAAAAALGAPAAEGVAILPAEPTSSPVISFMKSSYSLSKAGPAVAEVGLPA